MRHIILHKINQEQILKGLNWLFFIYNNAFWDARYMCTSNCYTACTVYIYILCEFAVAYCACLASLQISSNDGGLTCRACPPAVCYNSPKMLDIILVIKWRIIRVLSRVLSPTCISGNLIPQSNCLIYFAECAA